MQSKRFRVQGALPFLLTLFLGYGTSLSAQEEAGNTFSPEGKVYQRHFMSGSLGYSFIPKAARKTNESGEEEGFFVPSLGFDYFFRIDPHWEVGVMFDLDLGEYVFVPRELNREFAFVTAVITAYSIFEWWNVYFGGGIEWERNEHLGFGRVGTEFAIPLGRKGWVLAPGFFYDFKEGGFDTYAVALAVGKTFGKKIRIKREFAD